MFTKIMEEKEPWDIYILARWCYKNNIEFIDDKLFDGIEELLKGNYPDSEWFKTSYDSDKCPTDILIKYSINLEDTTEKVTTRIQKYNDILQDNRGISVKPIRNYEEAFEWYKINKGKEIMHSIKINGIHTKSILNISKNRIEVTSSRAAGGAEFLDYTDAVKTIYPRLNTNRYKNIKSYKNNLIPLACEAYVDREGIRILKEKHNISYVTERSAAIGVLRRNLVDLIPNNIHVTCFFNLDNLGTVSQGIDRAKLMGLEVVPYSLDNYIEGTFEEFKEWIDKVMYNLIREAEDKGIPYDGVVAQINSMEEYYKDFDDIYNYSNIGLKMGVTAAEVIKAEVEAIRLVSGGKSSVKLTPKIFLKPVITRDGNTVQTISGYTLDSIIDRKIQVGSVLEIIYQSRCYPTIK